MQQCLFDDTPIFQVSRKKSAKGTGKPRGHYKPRKKKIKILSFYEQLAQIQRELAIILKPYLIFRHNIELEQGNFLTRHKEEYEEYKYFKFWHKKYKYAIKSTLYNKDDVWICKYDFDNFDEISLELKGCEKLGIRESLYLHKRLLKLVKNHNLIEAAETLQPLILKFRQGAIILSDSIDTTLREIILNG